MNQQIYYGIKNWWDTGKKTWEPLTEIRLWRFRSVTSYVHANVMTQLPGLKLERKYNRFKT